jgi:hypothetical protein
MHKQLIAVLLPSLLIVCSIAALFLATGTAPANATERYQLHTDCRHEQITMYFDPKKPDDYGQPVELSGDDESGYAVVISYDAFRKLLKDLPIAIRAFKACDAYRKCLDDRDAGKVKRCYENDRRWREFFTGAW